jgi:hypothetical protein
MKTKNIFKTLAFAMLMPAVLLTTSCSKGDDAVTNPEKPANTETVANKGYALPVTVSATRQSDGTRAAFDGSKLNFSEGDKLFVGGNYDDWNKRFAGTLDYDAESGKFKGTIYTQDDTYKTYEDLFGYSDYTIATLLPAGYKDHGYLVIDTNDPDAQYDDFVEESNEYTLATSKADGVAQFSYEYSYNYNNGFALSPHNAILNFTITGLTASTSVNVSLTSMAYIITGTVTTDASGKATFAAGIMGGLNLQPFSLTVGGKNITIVSSDKDVAKGKIYNITRAAAPAPSYTMAAAATTSDKGKLICTAGHIHVYGEDAACTAGRVAKIIYVGPTGHATYNHGLALALEDMSTLLTWDNSGANNDGKTAAEWCSAWNTSKPVTDAEWLLASKDQWNYMLGTNGAGSSTTLLDGFTSVGGSNLESQDYWSSTEYESNTDEAWMFNFGYDSWYDYPKAETAYPLVRACLAF